MNHEIIGNMDTYNMLIILQVCTKISLPRELLSENECLVVLLPGLITVSVLLFVPILII